MLTPKWVDRFKRLAEEVSTWSKDEACKVGSVIVSVHGREVKSLGFNGPSASADDNLVYSLPNKNDYIVHAEVNALLRCHAWDCELALFITKAPCMQCAFRIVQCGLNITYAYFPVLDPCSKWYDEQVAAINLLQKNSVQVHFYAL